jgi:hypothetical protein
MKKGGRAVVDGVLIATDGSQLHVSLDKNFQGFELLSDDAQACPDRISLLKAAHGDPLSGLKGGRSHPPSYRGTSVS